MHNIYCLYIMEPINETNSKEISKTEEDLELGLGDIIQNTCAKTRGITRISRVC